MRSDLSTQRELQPGMGNPAEIATWSGHSVQLERSSAQEFLRKNRTGLVLLAVLWTTFLWMEIADNPALILPIICGWLLLQIVCTLLWCWWDRTTGRRRYADGVDVALLDEAPPGAFLVEIAIVQSGVRTGTDRGVMWLAEDLIAFNGHRTSFAIGRQDVAFMPFVTKYTNGLQGQIPLAPRGRSMSISVHTLSERRPSRLNVWALDNLFQCFRDVGRSREKRCLPPIAFDPLQTPTSLWRLALPFAFGLSVIALAFQWTDVLGVLLMTGLVSILVGATGLQRRAQFLKLKRQVAQERLP